jgi:CrcB protein
MPAAAPQIEPSTRATSRPHRPPSTAGAMTLLYLAAGGALGALARHAISGWIQHRAGPRFPWGTLGVNLTGCFLVGLVLTVVGPSPLSEPLGLFLAIGFLGDYTTYSTFVYETLTRTRDREWAVALAYAAASVGLGLLAVFAGVAAGLRFL